MGVDQFRDYLSYEKRYSKNTVRAYLRDIDQFKNFLKNNFEVHHLKSTKPVFVRSWIASMAETEMSKTSLRRKISSLRTYFKFLQKKGIVNSNPATDIATPKIEERLPQFADKKSIETLFNSTLNIFSDDFDGQRDRVMLELLYGTGMRRQELIDLTWNKVDESLGIIKILGKGNKERILPLGNHLKEVLSEFKQKTISEFGNISSYVLLTNSGNQMYPKFVYNRVKRYLSNVTTIEKKSPHILRHTFATHLSNNGASLNDIKELLGHASLASTQVYTHNTIEELKKVYKQAHPKS